MIIMYENALHIIDAILFPYIITLNIHNLLLIDTKVVVNKNSRLNLKLS